MIKANQGIRPKKPRPLGTSLEHGDWNWELSRPIPFAPSRLCAFALKTRHQGSIKAKTPTIKANRASSRQTMKKPKPHHNERQRRGLIPAYGNAIGNAPHLPLSPEGASHPIKAKTPVIVPNQASSRQPMKFLNGAVGRVTPCAPSWRIQTPTLASSAPINPGFLVGSPQRAAHCPPYLPSPLCASAPSRLCVKTPASSHNQALSRQMPFFCSTHPLDEANRLALIVHHPIAEIREPRPNASPNSLKNRLANAAILW